MMKQTQLKPHNLLMLMQRHLLLRWVFWSGISLLGAALVGCDGAALPTSSVSNSSSVESSLSAESSSLAYSSDTSSEASSDVGSLSSQSQSSQSSRTAADLPPLGACEAPNDRVLTDIASIVDWINAMPKPLSLACFLKSLPRPMYYNATLSTFSAQPSVGKRSPRAFLIMGDLLLSVVPDEKTETLKDPVTGARYTVWDIDGLQLLEVSQQIEGNEPFPVSIKGEFKFPVVATLPRNAPYVKIDYTSTMSVCAVCHAGETQVMVLDGQPVYRSEMLRNPRDSQVSLTYMLNEYGACDPSSSYSAAYRCQMLEALYGQGTLVWQSFPDDIPTIFK